MINPIAGPEAANSDFLPQQGVGMKVNRVEDLPFRVGKLLGSQKLKDMARASRAVGPPEAALKVGQEVIARFQR